MSHFQTIVGIVTDIVIRHKNGFTVFNIKPSGQKSHRVSGIFSSIREGDCLSVNGSVKTRQSAQGYSYPCLECIKYDYVRDLQPIGLEYYLDGKIQGVGPKRVKALIEKFGASLPEVAIRNPKELTTVPLISMRMANLIQAFFKSEDDARDIFIALNGIGIPPSAAIKLYEKFGAHTVHELKQNPYKAMYGLRGVGFKIIDTCAIRVGIELTDPDRVRFAIRYALEEMISEGSTLIGRGHVRAKALSLLSMDESEFPREFRSYLDEVVADPQSGVLQVSFRDTAFLTTREVWDNEESICRTILERVSVPGRHALSMHEEGAAESAIRQLEQDDSFSFSEQQLAFLKRITSANLHAIQILTGGPGTGKTTLIRAIVKLAKKVGASIALTAPTGRAANRMEETSDHPGRTIHRLLEWSPESHTFLRNATNKLDYDVIVVDEMSMTDSALMASLCSALKPETFLILVGDPNQLQSVGAGRVFGDLISGIPDCVTRLTQVHRQAETSLIVQNAHRILDGVYPVSNNQKGDDFFITVRNPKDIAATVIDIAMKRIPNGYPSMRFPEDIQILAPMHDGPNGIKNINTVVQGRLFPITRDKAGPRFVDGDRVMQTTNNYDNEVFNGEIGHVASHDPSSKHLRVLFSDGRKVVDYDERTYQEVTLAYAVTVHKSQGSEFPCVVLGISSASLRMMNRQILYTAITRGRKLVVIVTDDSSLKHAVKTCSIDKRETLLSKFMRGSDG